MLPTLRRKEKGTNQNLRSKKENILKSFYFNLDGEYSFSNVSIGVPVVLGKSGVEKIIELELSDQTKERFDKSVAVVKEAISSVEELMLTRSLKF